MQALCQNKKAFTDNDLQEISFFFWANCKKNRHSFSFATQNLGSMPFCVELDNIKDTGVPVHPPAVSPVAAG
jgi:hypothetical protein